MKRFTLLAAAAALLSLAIPAAAQNGLVIHDPYARVTPTAGAVYFLIENRSDQDDRLISANSDVAKMTVPMTGSQGEDGVSHMADAPDGFLIAGHGEYRLAPGHDHVMLMGLKQKLEQGDTFELTLTFALSGTVVVKVPVDNSRTTEPGMNETPYDVMTEMQH